MWLQKRMNEMVSDKLILHQIRRSSIGFAESAKPMGKLTKFPSVLSIASVE